MVAKARAVARQSGAGFQRTGFVVWQPLRAKSDEAAWRTIFAPILTSFSRYVISDQCSTSMDNANVSYGSRLFSTVHQLSLAELWPLVPLPLWVKPGSQ